jgi:hypothetical protein
MLTLRLHLDDCFADNGPLRVLPASHRDGKLSAQQIAEWRRREEEVVCALPRGGVFADATITAARFVCFTNTGPSSRTAHRMGRAQVTRRLCMVRLMKLLKHVADTTSRERCRKSGVRSAS